MSPKRQIGVLRKVSAPTVVGLATMLLFASYPAIATAQPEELRVRGAFGVGGMLSTDQRGWLGFSEAGLGGRLDAGWEIWGPLTIDARLAGTYFFSDTRGNGGVAELGVGASVTFEVPSWLRLGGFLHVNAGWSGDYILPTLDVGARAGIATSDTLAIGVEGSYHQIFFKDAERYSSDPRYWMLSVYFEWRTPRTVEEPDPEPEPEERVVVEEVPVERFIREDAPNPPPQMASDLGRLLDDALPVTRREEQTLIPPVLFHFDSTQMLPCGEVALHAAREVLMRTDEEVEIAGHADGVGEDDYNRDLSMRRANRVRDWLISRGVPPERLRVDGHGEAQPLEEEVDGAMRQINRRVTFRLVRVLEDGSERSLPQLPTMSCEAPVDSSGSDDPEQEGAE